MINNTIEHERHIQYAQHIQNLIDIMELNLVELNKIHNRMLADQLFEAVAFYKTGISEQRQ